MKFLARRALALLAWSPVLLAAAGCNSQGEGERCDSRNLHADCDEGLFCSDRIYVDGVYHQICCPAGGVRPTVAICNAGSGPPPDSGPRPDVSTSDGRNEGGGGDTSAPDRNGDDAVDEPSDDRSTLDGGADVSPDISIDAGRPDVRADAAGDASDAPGDLLSTPDQTSADGIDDSPQVDAPAPDTAPDATADATSEAPPDGPDLDTITPIDVGDVVDAPAEGGPG